MKNTEIAVDLTKGYDVMRGAKIVAHYPGNIMGLALANACAAQGKSRYIRYWGRKALSAVGCAEVA